MPAVQVDVAPPPTRSTTSVPAVQADVAPTPARGTAPVPDVYSRATVSVQSVQPRPPPRNVQPLEAPPTTGVPGAPTTPEDFLQRASRLERQGEVERAIEVLTRAIEKVPEAAVLYSKLALILVHQRKDYARAVQLLERAAELEPENTVLQQNLLKVTGLAAAAGGRKEQKRGLFARLTGRR
jgi:tetratricopeptide (TPR) repeat protein